MKYFNNIALVACTCMALGACTDNTELATPDVVKPEELQQREFLDEYDVLKNYVNRAENPNFKLGTSMSESEFTKKEVEYSLAVSNYDDITPANCMKHSSVVDENGNMNFGTVLKFVETAKEAGMSVYGHTLCWHSQQRGTYLNGLVNGTKTLAARKMASRAASGGCVKVTGNGGYVSVSQTLSKPLPLDKEFVLTCDIKSSSGSNKEVQLSLKGENNEDWTFYRWLTTTEWASYEKKTIPSDQGKDYNITKVYIQCQYSEGEYFMIDNISLKVDGEEYLTNGGFDTDKNGWSGGEWIADGNEGGDEGGSTANNMIDNGDFSSESISNFKAGGSEGMALERIKEGDNYVLKVTGAQDHGSGGEWKSQFRLQLNEEYNPGDELQISFKAKFELTDDGDKSTTGGVIQFQKDFYGTSNGGWSTFDISDDYTEITKNITIPETSATSKYIAILIGTANASFYFDDISVIRTKTAEPEPDPDPEEPEDKKQIVYDALENWIKSMMEACGGYVKTWDVVNEPMRDNGSLRGQNSDDVDDDTHFHWGRYLGDYYVREVVKLARQYFEESGGNPDELKLFINDYSLEVPGSKNPGNAKCKGLVDWIKKWEEDGVTKIDGIGTQMHVTYSENPETQAENERGVVEMFELLKSSGKLIKISELDMGIVSADKGASDANNYQTDEVTFVQLLKMAEYYNFIIRKYFEIIPAEQRYGISHWVITDSKNDENSFWRKGQPIGLWNLQYLRKPAYAGFADGLQGKEFKSENYITE